MGFEIIICKSGREGGCGIENTDLFDIVRFEEKQRQLGNAIIERTFCNLQMCGPRDANRDALTRLEELGVSQVTGILVTGISKKGIVYDKAPGVVLKNPDGTLKSEMF